MNHWATMASKNREAQRYAIGDKFRGDRYVYEIVDIQGDKYIVKPENEPEHVGYQFSFENWERQVEDGEYSKEAQDLVNLQSPVAPSSREGRTVQTPIYSRKPKQAQAEEFFSLPVNRMGTEEKVKVKQETLDALNWRNERVNYQDVENAVLDTLELHPYRHEQDDVVEMANEIFNQYQGEKQQPGDFTALKQAQGAGVDTAKNLDRRTVADVERLYGPLQKTARRAQEKPGQSPGAQTIPEYTESMVEQIVGPTQRSIEQETMQAIDPIYGPKKPPIESPSVTGRRAQNVKLYGKARQRGTSVGQQHSDAIQRDIKTATDQMETEGMFADPVERQLAARAVLDGVTDVIERLGLVIAHRKEMNRLAEDRCPACGRMKVACLATEACCRVAAKQNAQIRQG